MIPAPTKGINLGKYAKFWTSLIGFALTVASSKYAQASWFPYAVAAASSLGVLGVPNTPAPQAPLSTNAGLPAISTLGLPATNQVPATTLKSQDAP